MARFQKSQALGLHGLDALSIFKERLILANKPSSSEESSEESSSLEPNESQLRTINSDSEQQPDEAYTSDTNKDSSVNDSSVNDNSAQEEIEQIPEELTDNDNDTSIDVNDNIEDAILTQEEEPAKSNEEEELVFQPEKQQALDKITSYIASEFRDKERERLALLSTKCLNQIAEELSKIGEPGNQLAELNALYMARIRDPINLSALKRLDALATPYKKLITEVARTIQSDVIVNSLSNDEYIVAARQAISNLACLKQAILDLDPILSYIQGYEEVRKEQPIDLAMPESMAKLLYILKVLGAHASAAISKQDGYIEYQEKLQRELKFKEDQVGDLSNKLQQTRQHLSKQVMDYPGETTVFVYSRNNNKFLSSKAMPDGKNKKGRAVPLNSLYWSGCPTRAMRFSNRSVAVKAVDKVAKKLASLPKSKKGDKDESPRIAGEKLSDIGIASIAIKLPSE